MFKAFVHHPLSSYRKNKTQLAVIIHSLLVLKHTYVSTYVHIQHIHLWTLDTRKVSGGGGVSSQGV